MKKKKGKISLLLQKLRFKYRVSVVNENTFEESWHIHLSRFSVILYFFLFTILTFVLLTILIYVTPLRYYLPGYGETSDRSKIIQESLKTDSLMKVVSQQSAYIELIKKIINEEIQPDSISSLDSVALSKKSQELLEKSKKEEEFCKKFEEEEKFNLANISINKNENTYVFFRPVQGIITSSYSLQNHHYGINILTPPNQSVMSVLNGTVIFTGFTFDNDWVIQVQHENNYVSIYKNNTRLLKKVGDVVKAGETIAITGENNHSNKAKKEFYFELWQQGKPINPEEIIIF